MYGYGKNGFALVVKNNKGKLMYKTILVINMGMKSIRSIIFDNEGNKLASASVPLETSLT